MLKKGLAWHYTTYDHRMELSKVTSTLVPLNMTEWSAPFHLTDKTRACFDHFISKNTEVPDRWEFSVGESGKDEANRFVGIVEP